MRKSALFISFDSTTDLLPSSLPSFRHIDLDLFDIRPGDSTSSFSLGTSERIGRDERTSPSTAGRTRRRGELVSSIYSFRTPFDALHLTQRIAFQTEVGSLSDTISTLASQLSVAKNEKEETDKEQEDLLVLLEDLSIKRKADKRKMRRANMEVSEDEEEDSEEEEEPYPAEQQPEVTEQDHYAPEPTSGEQHVEHEPDQNGRGEEEYVYGEDSSVYDQQPFGGAATEGPSGWSPQGYTYDTHSRGDSLSLT